MTIYGHILPGAISIARSAERSGQLTERAKYKLKVLDWHRKMKKRSNKSVGRKLN